MACPPHKRASMTLYSTGSDACSHKIRLVLAEKGIAADVIEATPEQIPEDVLRLNPRGAFPMLLDRDLVLCESSIIVEYLDERFPHPPLLPVYPVARAKNRQMMYRIERDWYSLIKKIERGNQSEARSAAKQLKESLITVAPLFTNKNYFMNDEFSLVDCYLAPLLWRLPNFGISIPGTEKTIQAYAKKLFDRPTFVSSLTEEEQELAA